MSKERYPELDTLSANEHKIVRGWPSSVCGRSPGPSNFGWLSGKVSRCCGQKPIASAARRCSGAYSVQNGYDSLDNSVISKLVKIMDRRREVEAWRATLSDKQQREWSAPSMIFLHCPIFGRGKPATAAVTKTPIYAASDEDAVIAVVVDGACSLALGWRRKLT